MTEEIEDYDNPETTLDLDEESIDELEIFPDEEEQELSKLIALRIRLQEQSKILQEQGNFEPVAQLNHEIEQLEKNLDEHFTQEQIEQETKKGGN